MDQQHLRAGYHEARKITQKHAKTFYFASKFLPRAQRQAAYSVYALCRRIDDSVDESHEGAEKLQDIRKNITACYQDHISPDPLYAAFAHSVRKYAIPKVYFDELIEGVGMDTQAVRFANFSELYPYCYKVAGVIGLIMLQIFGVKMDPENAKAHAIQLGVAMQLTNILRDIKEDYWLGRIYLPRSEMQKFGITEDHLKQKTVDAPFIRFMRFQIQRAREYYQRAEQGIPLIQSRYARFVVCAMAQIYGGILTAIEKNHYDVFRSRAHLNLMDKLTTLIRITFQGQYL
jgi:phytoene synthase